MNKKKGEVTRKLLKKKKNYISKVYLTDLMVTVY